MALAKGQSLASLQKEKELAEPAAAAAAAPGVATASDTPGSTNQVINLAGDDGAAPAPAPGVPAAPLPQHGQGHIPPAVAAAAAAAAAAAGRSPVPGLPASRITAMASPSRGKGANFLNREQGRPGQPQALQQQQQALPLQQQQQQQQHRTNTRAFPNPWSPEQQQQQHARPTNQIPPQ
ncbi:unnamed protein product [Pylaiella littoralis]